MTADERNDLLARARTCDTPGDYPGVVALLGGVHQSDLMAEPELGFLLATALRRVGEWERAYRLTLGTHGRVSAWRPRCVWRERIGLRCSRRRRSRRSRCSASSSAIQWSL
jgi:hypothetical protein